MAEPVPQTPGAAEFRARVGSERWSFLVEQALERAEIVEQVAARVEQAGAGRRQSLRDVAPEVGWAMYLHWRRRNQSREGPGRERLPPPPVRIGDDIRLAACMLRRQDRSLNADGAHPPRGPVRRSGPRQRLLASEDPADGRAVHQRRESPLPDGSGPRAPALPAPVRQASRSRARAPASRAWARMATRADPSPSGPRWLKPSRAKSLNFAIFIKGPFWTIL